MVDRWLELSVLLAARQLWPAPSVVVGMHRRWATWWFVAGGAALAFGVCVPPAAAKVDHCVSPPDAKRVHASSDAIITVERHGDADLLDGGSQSETWRGCARRRGQQVLLEQGTNTFGGGHTARRFKLAGDFVAYLADDWTQYETTTSVTVVSLATERRWSSQAAGTGRGADIDQLAVNRAGDAAWIRVTIASDGHPRWRLVLRHEDHVALLARGRTAFTKLRLTTHRLSWAAGGKTQTRRL